MAQNWQTFDVLVDTGSEPDLVSSRTRTLRSCCDSAVTVTVASLADSDQPLPTVHDQVTQSCMRMPAPALRRGPGPGPLSDIQIATQPTANRQNTILNHRKPRGLTGTESRDAGATPRASPSGLEGPLDVRRGH